MTITSGLAVDVGTHDSQVRRYSPVVLRGISRIARCNVTVAAITALVVLIPGLAGAAPITNHQISGLNFFGGCLTTRVCAAGGYNSKGVGDVVALSNGVQAHVSTIPGSSSLYGISCPSSTSCVGVGNYGGSDIGIVSVNAKGEVTGTKKVSLIAGDGLTRISCVATTSCELAGIDIFSSPEQLVIGTWNGTTMVTHKVPVPDKGTDPSVQGISCSGATCEVVASAYVHSSTVLGLSLMITNGTSWKMHTASDDSLYGVSCISASRCYGAGYNVHGGVIVTFTNGSLTSTKTTPGTDLFGIACASTSCTAVGEELATGHTTDDYWGVIYPVNAGVPGTAVIDESAAGYNSVARIDSTFTAFGPAQRGGDGLVTVG
jgi:hypothetical protein